MSIDGMAEIKVSFLEVSFYSIIWGSKHREFDGYYWLSYGYFSDSSRDKC